MDVTVKIALHGGHHWEFVCDDGDAMLTGLVSALPGSVVDPSLPADGLIQVEARSGERIFLARSSLVSVTISRPPTHVTSVYSAKVGGGWPGTSAPTPFVLIPNCFDAATIAALHAGESAPASARSHEIKCETLPLTASDELVAVMSEAGKTLAVDPHIGTHLDVKLYNCPAGATLEPAACVLDTAMLRFFVLCPALHSDELSGSIELHDRLVADGEPSMRTLQVKPNVALVVPADARHGPLRLDGHGTAIVLIGVLRQNDVHG